MIVFTPTSPQRVGALPASDVLISNAAVKSAGDWMRNSRPNLETVINAGVRIARFSSAQNVTITCI